MVAIASVPLVLKATCRWRAVTPEEINARIRLRGRVRALLVVDPLVMPVSSGMEVVFHNFPELLSSNQRASTELW